MTNIKAHTDKHDFQMVTKKATIDELQREKGMQKDEILTRIRERDDFRDQVNFLAENKAKLEGKIYVVTC